MNRKQLAEHIGNIDDRLVAQAEHIPNYAALRRRKWVRQLLATAAVLALMISSFSVGALAFARETSWRSRRSRRPWSLRRSA